MLTYVIIGLAAGSIYALAAASMVVTYASAGILNFAFGSMAYFVARFFYWANQTHQWNLGLSAFLALAVVAPLLGVILYLAVFRFLRNKATLVKICAAIGVSVALPAIAIMLFDNPAITAAPGLAPIPVKSWQILGTSIDLDTIIIFASLLVVVVVGTVVMRYTDAGLKIRAVVSSEALTSLSGTNPNRVALGVWAVSGLLAGAAGIMSGPTRGIEISTMTALMASAFAAVVAAKLRNVGTAVVVALGMGVLTSLLQYWLPDNSRTSTAIYQSVPLFIIVVFLVWFMIRGTILDQEASGGGALDAAIKPAGGESAGVAQEGSADKVGLLSARQLVAMLPMVFLLVVPLLFQDDNYWLGLAARGIALAIIFLSFSLVTGDGGMIWLCQITFAGGGGLIAAKLSSEHGYNPIVAALIGALCMLPVGVLIGALTIRLGDLYVALVTLTFGLLIDTIIFQDPAYSPGLGGVPMDRPDFASSNFDFAYFALAVFCIIGLFIWNLRRSTTGLAMTGTRWSETSARMLGLRTVYLKLLLAGIAAFVAGLGGAMLTMYDQSNDPFTYSTFAGLIWLAVLVTSGVRSVTAALLAGLGFTLLPAFFSDNLSGDIWLQVPTVLFGLGAIGLATNPDGVVAMHGRQLMHLIFGVLFRGRKVDVRPDKLDDLDTDAVLKSDAEPMTAPDPNPGAPAVAGAAPAEVTR
ncbi:branched-chain amino acid ABC transporter permease [Jatrophihabitans fulvus]